MARALTKNDSTEVGAKTALQDAVGLPTGTTLLTRGREVVGRRWLLFSGWVLLSCLLFAKPLGAFVQACVSDDDSSYLILIPAISVAIVFLERQNIFRNLSHDALLGGCLVVLSCLTALFAHSGVNGALPGPRLSVYILSLVLVWIAGFGLLFGRKAVSRAGFPLLFLFLMVPLPTFILDRVTYWLQIGSAWITGLVFDVFGVPAMRDGLVFHLPRVSIEVAKECSGIRSSMVLLILALVVVHFCLKRFWTKATFVLVGLFVMILKNGIRIATLTLLSMYVDPGFLYGRLHHQGGILFFLFGLLLLLPVLRLLQHTEDQNRLVATAGDTT